VKSLKKSWLRKVPASRRCISLRQSLRFLGIQRLISTGGGVKRVLDVYVMPLWRFKAGDFHSPIEAAVGMRPKIVTADGLDERPARAGWFSRWRARRQVAAIRKAVESINGVPVEWADDGGVVYERQSFGFESLRAYANWLDCREQFPQFDPPPEGDYYKHPVMSVEVGRLSCPHLVEHDCYSGYYLPCEFERMVRVEPYLIFGQWPASRAVGSSPRLLRELDFVQATLQVPEGYQYPADDPLVAVKAAYLQLREVAELSCRCGLPIIFWG
jgi:hypothetical protein